MTELAFVEPYLKKLHGNVESNIDDIDIENQFLILYTVSNREFFDKDEYEEFYNFVGINTTQIEDVFRNDESIQHNTIRNYWKLYNKITKQLQIVECVELESGQQTAIIKTFWLKIFQRRCKKIFKERQEIIRKRSSPHALNYRRIHGKWPKDCINLPTYF